MAYVIYMTRNERAVMPPQLSKAERLENQEKAQMREQIAKLDTRTASLKPMDGNQIERARHDALNAPRSLPPAQLQLAINRDKPQLISRIDNIFRR